MIIPKGIDIEIQNMDFRFGPEGRIIIENGNGTLEGGELTLTNTICQGVFCDETNTWKGIEVWGDPTQLNFGGLSGGKRRFGSILVQSSSQIKNAEIGILAASRQHAPTNNPKHGGLIEVESSSFINCQRGIEMRAHKYFNYSYIENNTFTINDSYDHTTQPEAHITLREVGRGFGIPITGNTLQDVRPTSVIPLNRAWGIYSLDSKFRVESCTLKTLRYGIYAVASIRTNTFFASNNLFDLNHRGLYARGIDYLSTIDNDFSVSGVWSYSYGEYLNGCSDFEVQRNDFYCNQDGTSPLGIIINESNGFDEIDANKIANNTFSDLFIGTSVYGDNDGVAGNPNDIPFLNPGLHILCGDYTNNYIDIYIPSGASINDPQGKCFEDSDLDDFPAGNTFSRTCVTTESDYFLGTGDDKPEVTTYWHNNDIAHTPDCHSTRLEPTNASCGNYNNECNTEYYESLELSRSIDTIKTKIQSASDSVSTIADTIIKGFWLGHQKWLASRAINHYLIIDSTESSLDSMKAISENERDFYGLAFQHLVESDSSKMHTYLDSIDNANDTIGRYFDSLYVYQTDTLFIEEIDTASSFFDYVNSAADDSSLTISKNAQTIVQRITNNFFEEPIIVPQDSSSKRGEPLAVHNEFEVYPNPTDNMIYLKDNSKSHQINRLHVQLINTVGERVYTGELTSFSNVMVLDVSGIASGLYVLQVYDKGRIIFTTKVSIL